MLIEVTDDRGTHKEIVKNIELCRNLNEEQRTRLQQIAAACPVNKILDNGLKTTTIMKKSNEVLQ